MYCRPITIRWLNCILKLLRLLRNANTFFEGRTLADQLYSKQRVTMRDLNYILKTLRPTPATA